MKLLIAIPTFESVFTETYEAVLRLDTTGHDVTVRCFRGYTIDHARNAIAKATLEGGYDAVLMVDADVVPRPEHLRMLVDLDVPVALGAYAHRGKRDGKTCLCKTGRRNYDRQYTGDELRAQEALGKPKVKIKGGGMGFALIRREALEATGYPWFKWTTYPSGGVLSEDLYFCEQCRSAKVPIYADARVRCGHIFREVVEL